MKKRNAIGNVDETGIAGPEIVKQNSLKNGLVK